MHSDERREFIAKTLLATAGFGAASLSHARTAETEPAKNEGTQDEPTWLVVYSAGANWPSGTPLSQLPLRPHGAYMLDLYRRGIMRLAGGFGDGSGGAVLFTAADEETAANIVSNDPAVSTGLFTFALRRWNLVDWAKRSAASR